MKVEIACDVDLGNIAFARPNRSTIKREKGWNHSSRPNIGGTKMTDESRSLDRQHPIELIPDFAYESHYEFVARLAHKLWVQRGRPLGSPDVDWFAAEQAVYASLVAAGTITSSSNDPQSIRNEVDRWMQGA